MKKKKMNPQLIIGLTCIGLLILMCLLSFFWTPQDPYLTQDGSMYKNMAANSTHWLGTDHLGRDVFSRLMIASQNAFLVGISTLLISGFIGTMIGILAGYYGKLTDQILMRFVDIFTTIPGTILLLLFVAIFGRGTIQTIIAISLMNFTTFARMIRSKVLSLKNQEHIAWAKNTGASHFRIIFSHIFPDLIPLILVISAMKFSGAIMAEAGLSYLGLGIQPPTPSWGNMLTRAQAGILSNPFNAITPGIMISISVIGFNLLSDGISKYLNVMES